MAAIFGPGDHLFSYGRSGGTDFVGGPSTAWQTTSTSFPSTLPSYQCDPVSWEVVPHLLRSGTSWQTAQQLMRTTFQVFTYGLPTIRRLGGGSSHKTAVIFHQCSSTSSYIWPLEPFLEKLFGVDHRQTLRCTRHVAPGRCLLIQPAPFQ